MSIHALLRHPDSQCDAVTALEVELEMSGGVLQLCYRIVGDLARLALPPIRSSMRMNELWRHTCCEAFIAGDATDYYEFNFSPSTAWAAYRFGGYRVDMTPAEIGAPKIDVQTKANVFELAAGIDLRECATLRGVRRLGVSCVLEERSGRISYWALAHPPGKADFHHADGFTLELIS